MSCNICIEPLNKTKHSLVKCMCDYECCRKCAQTYLLGRIEDPACMNCNVAWTRKFMTDNLGKTFMLKDYKNHREKVLLDRELSMLQATQPFVEREIKKEQIEIEITQLERKIKELKDELSDICNPMDNRPKKQFIRKCPNGECHGFLSTSLKCSLCQCWACKDCREVKGFNREQIDEHKCNPDIIKSIELLNTDTKPCPKCSAMICKISGCDQLWCVECHTAFSWNTGKIEIGVIHNPHYFEYHRRINNGIVPRNPLDIQCGRELNENLILIIRNVLGYYVRADGYIYAPSNAKRMEVIGRKILHIKYVEQARFRINDRLENNLQLRINYMRNKISKDKLKNILQKNEKKDDKRQVINNVLDMFVNCMTDLFYRLIDDKTQLDNIMIEMTRLINYTNECFIEIGKTYNSITYRITEDFKFEKN